MCIQAPVFALLLINFIGGPKKIDLEGSVRLGYDDAKLHNQLAMFQRKKSLSSSMI